MSAAARRATLVVTAPGFVAIREMSKLLADFEIAIVTTYLRSVNPEGIDEAWQHLQYTIDQIATTSPDVVVQNTVAFSLDGNPSSPGELEHRLARAIGAPAAVGLLSVLAALQELGVSRPLVIAPYPEVLRDRFQDAMSRHGIALSGWQGPVIKYPAPINDAPADADAYVEQGLAAAADADGILINGGGWSSLDLAAGIEARTGLPVLTSNVAEAWHARRLCGLPDRRPVASLWRHLAIET